MIIVCGVFEALFARGLLSLFEAARAYTDEARLEIEIIMQGHGLYRKGMRTAHEAPADHAYAYLFHGL